MPQYNPNAPSMDFSDAPGGSLSLDDLFPIEDESLSATTPNEPGNPSQPQDTPQAYLSADEVFLRAGDTIYKTREDALNGIAHKDSVISDLRSKLSSTTGVDPITGRPTVAASQTQSTQPPAPINYAQDQSQYFDDLVEAVQKQDKTKYAQVQQKFLQDTFAPVAPLLVDVARSRAVDQVASEIPDFKTYQNSQSYKETLDLTPSLKEAITMGETYIDAASRLPELYRLAYYAGQGRRVPELVRAAAQQVTPAVATPTTPGRPTTSPSTLNPPPPAAPADLRSSEGRKQLIADAERKGIADMKF